MNEWLYFGCHQVPGHYLFRQDMQRTHVMGKMGEKLERFDGLLPPQDSIEPYVAVVSRLEGWGMSALAFWDYSVDKRQGSNSIIFAPSLTIEPEAFLTEAQQRFPKLFDRLPQPVRLKYQSK